MEQHLRAALAECDARLAAIAAEQQSLMDRRGFILRALNTSENGVTPPVSLPQTSEKNRNTALECACKPAAQRDLPETTRRANTVKHNRQSAPPPRRGIRDRTPGQPAAAGCRRPHSSGAGGGRPHGYRRPRSRTHPTLHGAAEERVQAASATPLARGTRTGVRSHAQPSVSAPRRSPRRRRTGGGLRRSWCSRVKPPTSRRSAR